MRFTIDPKPPTTDKESHSPWWKKMAWFAGLYVASIVVVGGFVYGMRLMLGMHG